MQGCCMIVGRQRKERETVWGWGGGAWDGDEEDGEDGDEEEGRKKQRWKDGIG